MAEVGGRRTERRAAGGDVRGPQRQLPLLPGGRRGLREGGAGGHDPRDGRVDRRHRHRGQKQALRRQGSANKHSAVVPLCF